jgi:uncharacterized membrane protein
MRYAFRALGLLLALAIAHGAAAAEAPHVKGLWLTTPYPAITARAGATTDVKLKVQNYDLPPQRVALAISGVPEGWKAIFLGDGSPVAAAMPATNDNVPLQLRLDIPAGVTTGTHTLVLHAKGQDASVDLPLAVSIGQGLPAQLSIKADLPSLRGTPQTSFGYQFTVKNESSKDLLVKLAADAPSGFQTSFTEAYGSQQISSIPIQAGKSKDLKVTVQPPDGVAARDYPVMVHVASEGAEASTRLVMEITGQPKLKLVGADGRVSGNAEAGTATPISLVVSNDGSAPARDIELSASPPSDWKVDFQPSKIDELAPNQKRTVQALLTPSAKALAGDYMTTFRANGKNGSSSADFRITVATSTLWGIIGVAIIALALLVAVGAVTRFGRR